MGEALACMLSLCKVNPVIACSYTSDANAKLPASNPDAWCHDGSPFHDDIGASHQECTPWNCSAQC